MSLVLVSAAAFAASMPIDARVDAAAAAVLLNRHDGQPVTSISLRCPRFVLDGQTVGGAAPTSIRGRLDGGRQVVARFAPILLQPSGALEVELYAKWSARERVLRKWSRYRVVGRPAPELVREIVLHEIGAASKCRQVCRVPPQSYPLLYDGGFAGIEYPVATTRVESGVGIVGHCPAVRVPDGEWRTSRTAVIGLAEVGRERPAFEAYVRQHYTHRKQFHVDYNAWWTTGIPYVEQDVLDLMRIFSEKLQKPYGVPIDSFCIDLGWSNRHSIWEIDPKLFPEGFTRVAAGARSMGGNLGLWLSPISAYPEGLDNVWAAAQGIKTFPGSTQPGAYRLICPTDRRYRDALQSGLVGICTRYGLRHLKFDSYRLECPEADHGHEPGPLSAEAMAESIISICSAVRAVVPDMFIESDAFGAYQSPWWLWHTDALLSQYGADSPYGLVPCPTYRESYTSARDYYNLMGDAMNVVPVADLHVCGFVHQSPDPFMNDGVMTVMRGSRFLPFYVNPAYMDEPRWEALAALLKWARANAPILEHTHPMPPEPTTPTTAQAPMTRSPYGYAHWKGDRGLIVIRNPWIAPTTYRLHIDERSGLLPRKVRLTAKSIYPEPRVYATGLDYGDTLAVPLAPYETVVLSLRPDKATQAPNATDARRRVRVGVGPSKIERIDFEDAGASLGADTIDRTAGATTGVRVQLRADVEVDAPGADLLVLIEDTVVPLDPIAGFRVNGAPVQPSWSGSDTGWAADNSRSAAVVEQWLFARVPLAGGASRIDLDVMTRSEGARVSAWVWAHRPGRKGILRGRPLPEPEVVSLDAAQVLAPVSAKDLPHAEIRSPRLLERIDGVFLDAIDTVTAGGALLQRNKNTRESPMIICGRHYSRGLGTMAPSRIAVPADGSYRRLQGWVGVDAGVELWDDSIVTFEIHGDGKKLWSSGPMVRNEPAKRVDIDVTGVRKLELVSINSGNRKTAARAFNLGDWGEMCLIR